MTLDELCDMWDEDAKIPEDLETANYEISKLHAKYSRLLAKAKVELVKVEGELKKLKFRKQQFWTNNPKDKDKTPEEMKWKSPVSGKVFKQDLDRWLKGDAEIVDYEVRIAEHFEMIQKIERIMYNINQRSFILRAILDTKRFYAGLN